MGGVTRVEEIERVKGGGRAPPLSATRSRIHERTVSLRLLGIIMRVFRLKVSLYNAYFSHQSQTTFAQGEGE